MSISSDVPVGFASIGPFTFSKTDAVVANVTARLRHGPLSAQTKITVSFILAAILIVNGIVSDFLPIVFVGFMVVFVFLLLPTLQAAANSSKSSLIYHDENGIGLESSEVKIIYKWDIIKSFERYGHMFYIYTHVGCILCIPIESTEAKNIERLISTLKYHECA